MYDYKVIPAPAKGIKAKGVKTPEARFALGVEQAINELAAEGWEYQRSDVLPSEERQGLTGTATHWRTLLVFRRAIVPDVTVAPAPTRVEPRLTAAPVVVTKTGQSDAAPSETDFEEGTEDTRPG